MSDQDILTIWKISHLLFPNSTQAKSFYYEFVQRSGINENNVKFDVKTLSFLFYLFLKTPVFKSAQGFIDVDNINQTQWPNLSRKLSKLEQFILLGLLVLKIDFNKLGLILKMDPKLVQLKFQRALQKEFPYPKIDESIRTQFNYNKWDEQKRVPFFIRESIFERVFMGSRGSDHKAHKDTPAVLNSYENLLNEFKDNFGKIAIDPRSIPNREQSEDARFNNDKKKAFNHSLRKYFLSVTVILGSVVVILLVRPNIIQQIMKDEPLQVVELQQISFSKAEIALPADSLKVSGDNEIQNKQTTPIDKPDQAIIAQEKPQEVKPVVSAVKNNGVFRGTIYVNDIQAVSHLVREKLINLGGQKAGEVELGWMKTDKISYFHFILPQDSHEAFSQFLNQFGKIQIKFEPHPRVLPTGKSRYIIEIKDNE